MKTGHPVFDAAMETPLETNLGLMKPMQILDHLTYISYATQRDHGMTHEQLIKIGLGNEAMKTMYDQEQPNSSLP
jgi:hypothetical protein